MNNTYTSILERRIRSGQYLKADMLELLNTFFASQQLSAEQYKNYLALIDQCTDPTYTPPETTEQRQIKQLQDDLETVMMAVAEIYEMGGTANV